MSLISVNGRAPDGTQQDLAGAISLEARIFGDAKDELLLSIKMTQTGCSFSTVPIHLYAGSWMPDSANRLYDMVGCPVDSTAEPEPTWLSPFFDSPFEFTVVSQGAVRLSSINGVINFTWK